MDWAHLTLAGAVVVLVVLRLRRRRRRTLRVTIRWDTNDELTGDNHDDADGRR